MSEYERLKKQRDEIIKRQAEKKATEIVDDIMTSGSGKKAERLVLTTPDIESLGGWCRQALIDRIAGHLANERITLDERS